MPTGDLAYQISAGVRMIDGHTILTRDVFTFTYGGREWLDLQWAAEIILGGLFKIVGWRGLVVVRAVLVSVVAGATLIRTRAKGADMLVAGATTVGFLEIAFLVPRANSLRPQLLAVPLFVLALWLLDQRQRRPAILLWLIPTEIVWANFHGSFILLIALVGIAFFADLVAKPRRPAIWTGAILLASLVAPLVSPLGFGTYRYLRLILSSPVIRIFVDEWQPLWRVLPAGPVFLVAVIAAIVVIVKHGTRRPTFEEGLQVLLLSGLAVWSARNLLWWALATPPIVGGLLAGWRPHRTGTRSLGAMVGAVLAALLLIGCVRVATIEPAQALLSEAPTQELTDAVGAAAKDGARVFDGWWWSWFELELPNVPMFVDARTEMFPLEVWVDYFTIVQARAGWMEALDRWNIGVIVTDKSSESRLIRDLRSDPDWTLRYEDPEGVVFTRS
jgi:hypothetical protein